MMTKQQAEEWADFLWTLLGAALELCVAVIAIASTYKYVLWLFG